MGPLDVVYKGSIHVHCLYDSVAFIFGMSLRVSLYLKFPSVARIREKAQVLWGSF